jgi:UDP-N-acetyl-D-mannosaminuronic acid transferase (WecB/TagA/CpsF family)
MFTYGDKVKLTLKARRKLCEVLEHSSIETRHYYSKRFGVGVFNRFDKVNAQYVYVNMGYADDYCVIKVIDLELFKQ